MAVNPYESPQGRSAAPEVPKQAWGCSPVWVGAAIGAAVVIGYIGAIVGYVIMVEPNAMALPVFLGLFWAAVFAPLGALIGAGLGFVVGRVLFHSREPAKVPFE